MKTELRAERRTVYGQSSWRLASAQVEAFVTESGGHLGPVTFDRRGRRLQPYSVAPWAEEKLDASLPAILKVLRGDFFCLPFGGNMVPYRRERHPVHGETANARWTFQSLTREGGRHCLHLSLNTRARRGRVDKRIWLLEGQDSVYCQHVVSGMSGPMNLGHHAMLKFPDEPASGRISTSRVVFGQAFPEAFESPEKRGYSLLKTGARFQSLAAVPTITGARTDLSRFPARRGFEDLVLLVSNAAGRFAWTAVTFPKERYVWFALKDPRILRETVLWFSNGGRYYPPWNGRHINVMGLEEVTSYFHLGLAEAAAKNPLSQKGWPTCLSLDPENPLIVPYIMGVAPIPAGFDRVVTIRPVKGKQAILLQSASGRQSRAAVDVAFLGAPAGW